MGKHKQRHQLQHFNDTSDIFDPIEIDIWCGNNEALEHRQNWDSRKTSYFGIAKGIQDGQIAWALTYKLKVFSRTSKQSFNPKIKDYSQYVYPIEQAKEADYANVPKDVPGNPDSFMWKCPRCNRIYQLNLKILEPYLDDLMNIGQTKVSAAHLEAVQSKILRAKQGEATDHNRP